MARKKRYIPEQFRPVVQEDKTKVAYRDEFQSNVGEKVQDFGSRLEGKGKTILYAIAALAILAALFGIFNSWNRRSTAAAQTALGKAIETSQGSVVSADSPAPVGFTGKTFASGKERAEAAISEFQTVADNYGNPVQEKAKYFIAVNRLVLDRAAGTQELEALAKSNSEVGTLSKFALAQAKNDDGKTDEAAALYQELAALQNPILSKDTINFELAKIYEKQGKQSEAAELYFNIAKPASEAKDLEGNPIPMSETARTAKQKVEQLNPDKAKEIVEPAASSPAGTRRVNL
jgi:hypothetical protein